MLKLLFRYSKKPSNGQNVTHHDSSCTNSKRQSSCEQPQTAVHNMHVNFLRKHNTQSRLLLLINCFSPRIQQISWANKDLFSLTSTNTRNHLFLQSRSQNCYCVTTMQVCFECRLPTQPPFHDSPSHSYEFAPNWECVGRRSVLSNEM